MLRKWNPLLAEAQQSKRREGWNSTSMEWQAWEENGSVSCLWGGIHPCILVEGKKKSNGDERKVQKQDLELIGEDVLFAFPLLSAPWALLEAKALRVGQWPGWANIITATSY